jgi:histidinol phosphatase-like enzyme
MEDHYATDLDGTVINYDSRDGDVRFNTDFLAKLRARKVQRIHIVTNQGGCVFHDSDPAKYPSVDLVAVRIRAAIHWLRWEGIQVDHVLACTYHPRASELQCAQLRSSMRTALLRVGINRVLTFSEAQMRKPEPGMLLRCKVSIYFGDDNTDEQAARAAGIEFVRVKRFE